jgi:ABC-type glycerol-3-phosphate transport system permease component
MILNRLNRANIIKLLTMEKKESFFTVSWKKVEQYLEDKLLLLRLQTVEKTSKLISLMFIGLVVTVLSLFILIFLSLMAGYYFASLTHSIYLGFGIVAAVYILLLVFLIFKGKKILEKYITNIVIETFFHQTAEHDNNENGTS